MKPSRHKQSGEPKREKKSRVFALMDEDFLNNRSSLDQLSGLIKGILSSSEILHEVLVSKETKWHSKGDVEMSGGSNVEPSLISFAAS